MYKERNRAEGMTIFMETSGTNAIAGIAFNGEENQKLKLSIRTTLLVNDLRSANLPESTKDLVQLLIEKREESLQSKYDMILILLELKTKGEFWLDLHYQSFEAFLADNDLPINNTLSYWQMLVETFAKETFILVGIQALQTMVLFVSEYQSDIDKKKLDYQNIFDNYCHGTNVFNKKQFLRIVNWYIEKTYIKPPKDGNDSIEGNSDDTAASNTPNCKKSRKRSMLRDVKVSAKQSLSPIVTKDVEVMNNDCSGCSAKNERLRKAEVYILALEYIITKELGESFLPLNGRPSF